MHLRISSHLLRAALSQAVGVAAAVVFALGMALVADHAPGTGAWIGVQAIGAAATARLLRMEWWWWLLNLAFGPALAMAWTLDFSPQWSALMLAGLLLAYGGTQRTRVPLYLSSSAAVKALTGLLPEDAALRILDLGCGTGTILSAISRERPLSRLAGVERAPLPWLVAWIRSCVPGNRFAVSWGNLWNADLSAYDVVYAYLSPEPMPLLWQKARREMRPGSMLVSFRFAVPGVEPGESVRVGGAWLYVWRM